MGNSCCQHTEDLHKVEAEHKNKTKVLQSSQKKEDADNNSSTSVDSTSKRACDINFMKMALKMKEKADSLKPKDYVMRAEDRKFINSDKSYINVVLKTQDWMGGEKPT